MFTISKCAIELYDAKPLSWLDTKDNIIGSIWLTVEISTFFGTLLVNMLFMFLRSLRENEVRIELIDKRKQLPSVDTIESLSVLMQ